MINKLAFLMLVLCLLFIFFFQAEDGIRDDLVTGVQTCALPIPPLPSSTPAPPSVSISSTMGRAHSGFAQTTERDRIKVEVEKLLERTVKMRGSRSEERRVGEEGRCRGGRCE